MEIFKNILIWYLVIGVPICLLFTLIAYNLRKKKVNIGLVWKKRIQIDSAIETLENQIFILNNRTEKGVRISVEQLQTAERRLELCKDLKKRIASQSIVYILVDKKEPKKTDFENYLAEFEFEKGIELSRLEQEDKIYYVKR
jgi:hypothetical protein